MRTLGWLGFWLLMVFPVVAQEDFGEALTFGVPASGRITASNPRTTYFFDGLRGEVISIALDVTGGNLDPILTVLNPKSDVIVSVDDYQGSRAPGLSALRLPDSGRYRVIVARFGDVLGTTSGSFALEISRVGVSSASGSTLRYGDQVINSISNMNAQLYYSFRAQRGDIINVQMRRVSGDLDPYLQIVDTDARVLADNDDTLGSPTPSDSTITGLVIEADGTYVIVASRYGQAAGTSTGNFVLMLEEADNSGLGNTVQTAIPLTAGTTINGELTSEQFTKYYRFEAQADDIITVRMTRLSGGLDAFLAVANTGLVELVTDDDSGGGQNAMIDQYRIPAAGTYYIIATRFDRDAGTSAGAYRLELLSLGNAFDTVTEDTERISYGTTVTGRIDDSTPELQYAFWGVEGDTITVSMNRGDGNLDPVVSILNTDLNPVVSDDDSGGGQNARINTYTIPATGTYYIRATRYSGDTGPANTEGSFILVLARRFS